MIPTFETLHSVLTTVYKNPYSDFYRTIHGKYENDFVEIGSWEDWERIPLFSKKDILDVPYYERIFIPPEQVDIVRTTSGTSGGGIACIPRIQGYFKALPATSPLRNPYTHLYAPKTRLDLFYPSWEFSEQKQGTQRSTKRIGGDPARMDVTAKLASSVKIDAINGTASMVLALSPYLAETYDLSCIKRIDLTSDRCTVLQERAIRHFYPRALLTYCYAMSESRQVAFSTAQDNIRKLTAHPFFYIEILDDKENAIHTNGVAGELVLTTLHPENYAFPLIRYRTGDRAVFVERTNDALVLSILGRMTNDRVRITGGELRLTEIEKALEIVGGRMIVDYEVTIQEISVKNMPLLQLCLHAKVLHASMIPDKQKSLEIERLIAANLRINNQRTYADGITRGIYAPITCTYSHLKDGREVKKSRQIVDMRS